MTRFDRYVGLPWVDKGRSFAGVDCWGLRYLIFRDELGVELPSLTDRYATASDRRAIAALVEGRDADHDQVPAGAERAFDGVLMLDGAAPTHIGTVIAPGLLLHVVRGGNSVVERYRSPLFSHPIEGFYRYRMR